MLATGPEERPMRITNNKVHDYSGRTYVTLTQGAGDAYINVNHVSYDELLELERACRAARREIERRRRDGT